MAPFDRSYTTTNGRLSIALSCIIFEIFDVEVYCDLEIEVRSFALRIYAQCL